MRNKRYLLFFVFFFLFGAAPDAQKERFELLTGEVELVSFDQPVQVQLSRRGVVYADSPDGRQWHLTGLRRGVVVASFYSRLGEMVRSMVINVDAEQPVRSLLQRGRFPTELCSFANVICHSEEGLIEGEVDSFYWLYYARNRCKESRVCRSAISLSQEAQSQLQKQVKTLVEERVDKVHISRGGMITLTLQCVDKPDSRVEHELTEVLATLALEDQMSFVCDEKTASKGLWLQLYIVQQEKQETTEANWPDVDVTTTRTIMPPTYQGWLTFNRTDKMGYRVLASPAVQITPGHKVELQSGSELRVEARGADGDAFISWKPLGVMVTATLLNLHGGEISLESEVRLTGQRAAKGQITSSQLATRVNLDISRLSLLGTVNLEQHHSESSTSRFLEKVPIIAPLFRQKNQGTSRSRILVYARLDPIDPTTEYHAPDSQKDILHR